jgi:hypothetical protein
MRTVHRSPPCAIHSALILPHALLSSLLSESPGAQATPDGGTGLDRLVFCFIPKGNPSALLNRQLTAPTNASNLPPQQMHPTSSLTNLI